MFTSLEIYRMQPSIGHPDYADQGKLFKSPPLIRRFKGSEYRIVTFSYFVESKNGTKLEEKKVYMHPPFSWTEYDLETGEIIEEHYKSGHDILGKDDQRWQYAFDMDHTPESFKEAWLEILDMAREKLIRNPKSDSYLNEYRIYWKNIQRAVMPGFLKYLDVLSNVINQKEEPTAAQENKKENKQEQVISKSEEAKVATQKELEEKAGDFFHGEKKPSQDDAAKKEYRETDMKSGTEENHSSETQTAGTKAEDRNPVDKNTKVETEDMNLADRNIKVVTENTDSVDIIKKDKYTKTKPSEEPTESTEAASKKTKRSGAAANEKDAAPDPSQKNTADKNHQNKVSSKSEHEGEDRSPDRTGGTEAPVSTATKTQTSDPPAPRDSSIEEEEEGKSEDQRHEKSEKYKEESNEKEKVNGGETARETPVPSSTSKKIPEHFRSVMIERRRPGGSYPSDETRLLEKSSYGPEDLKWVPKKNLSEIPEGYFRILCRLATKIKFLECTEPMLRYEFPAFCYKTERQSTLGSKMLMQMVVMNNESFRDHDRIEIKHFRKQTGTEPIMTKCKKAAECMYSECPYIIAAYIKYLMITDKNQIVEQRREYQENKRLIDMDQRLTYQMSFPKFRIMQKELTHLKAYIESGLFEVTETETRDQYVISMISDKKGNPVEIDQVHEPEIQAVASYRVHRTDLEYGLLENGKILTVAEKEIPDFAAKLTFVDYLIRSGQYDHYAESMNESSSKDDQSIMYISNDHSIMVRTPII